MANPEMAAEFLASNGEKPRRPKPERAARKRAPLPKVSEKQQAREDFLAGIKAERIDRSLLLIGYVQCENCPQSFDTFTRAKNGLQLHHSELRSRGARYKPGNMGVDAPRLLVLLCSRCHQALHSNPEWTKSDTPSEVES